MAKENHFERISWCVGKVSMVLSAMVVLLGTSERDVGLKSCNTGRL